VKANKANCRRNEDGGWSGPGRKEGARGPTTWRWKNCVAYTQRCNWNLIFEAARRPVDSGTIFAFPKYNTKSGNNTEGDWDWVRVWVWVWESGKWRLLVVANSLPKGFSGSTEFVMEIYSEINGGVRNEDIKILYQKPAEHQFDTVS